MARTTRRSASNTNANPYDRNSYNSYNSAYSGNSVYSANSAAGINRKTLPQRNSSSLLPIVMCIVTLVLGLILGYFLHSLFSNTSSVPSPVNAALSEAELTTAVVGKYSYNGQEYTIVAKDAIEDSSTLDSERRSDGLYNAPSADMILSRARNEIIAKLVKDNNITVTEQEARQFALENMGTDDVSALARNYGIGETQMQRILTESAGAMKLYRSVAGYGNAPSEPVAPSNGDTETANYEYADYIKSLLGPLWDSTTNTWANTDNEYYRALSNMTFSADSANFEAAEAAYAVAYAAYANSTVSGSSQWESFINRYLDESSIVILTLRA